MGSRRILMATAADITVLRRNLIGKVIEFTAGVADLEVYAEEGMKARVKGFRLICEGEVVEMVVDYSEFEKHNEGFESANYYDDNGNPILTAREAGFYEPRDTIFLDGTQKQCYWNDLFILAEDDKPEMFWTITRHHNNDLMSVVGVTTDLQRAVAYLEHHPEATRSNDEVMKYYGGDVVRVQQIGHGQHLRVTGIEELSSDWD
jgi:hypothetical protein